MNCNFITHNMNNSRRSFNKKPTATSTTLMVVKKAPVKKTIQKPPPPFNIPSIPVTYKIANFLRKYSKKYDLQPFRDFYNNRSVIYNLIKISPESERSYVADKAVFAHWRACEIFVDKFELDSKGTLKELQEINDMNLEEKEERLRKYNLSKGIITDDVDTNVDDNTDADANDDTESNLE